MDSKTQEICAATRRFYAANAASFSGTRQEPWDGWERLAPLLHGLPENPTVLDIGCGNLRFERFLDAAALRPARVVALDACAELLNCEGPDRMSIQRIQTDIVSILDEPTGCTSLGIPPCDLTVAFGFMHHLPTPTLRRNLLEALINTTRPQGLCIVSFWQFGKDERIAKKAKLATASAEEALGIQLPDAHDHFLGWQSERDSFRFCHDFTDDEVDALKIFAEDRGVIVVDDFYADGKNGDLNRYLVFRRG